VPLNGKDVMAIVNKSLRRNQYVGT
jgi:hypothetical protein